MIRIVALVLALLTMPSLALAQASAVEVYRYPEADGPSGLGDLRVVQNVDSQSAHRVRLYLRLGEKLSLSPSFTDTVESTLDQYMGSPRPALFPGAEGAVALFSVSDADAVQALCPGANYLKLGVFQPPGFTAFRPDKPVRLFLLKPANLGQSLSYELCRTLDFGAGALAKEE